MAITRYLQLSDEQLVVGALLGDMRAFDALVRRFRGAVIHVAAQTLGGYAGAEDIAQEALLLAFKALPQLQDPAQFASWLYAITRHRARRVGARENRSEPTQASTLDRLLLLHAQELSAHPVEALLRQSEHDCLSAAVAQLPPAYQLVLRLYYYEDWSVAQMGSFLGLPQTTIKWRLHRSRALLRRQLTEQQTEREKENQE